MAKTYVLNSTAMKGGNLDNTWNASWNNYKLYGGTGDACLIGGTNSIDIAARYYATYIMFDATTLNTLRSKTILSVTLNITASGGTMLPKDSTSYIIGYKYSTNQGSSSASNAWQRGNVDSTATSSSTSDDIAGYVRGTSTRQEAITSNTSLSISLATTLPKYGYVLGDSNSGMISTYMRCVSSATLVVVTNEVDYSFTLSYNANGGTGAPSAQTGTGTVVGTPSHTFTISNTQPTRDGFFFDGWKTAGGSTLYQPGGSITVTASTTLYAQWSPASSIISSVTSSVPITGDSSTGAVTISITRYNSSYTHDVKITLGTRSTTLTGQGTSVSYTIPASWLDQIPEAIAGTATVEVTTKSGSTIIGVVSSATFTATVPASVVPTVTFTSTDVNENETIDGWDVLVQGYSQIKLDVVAAAGSGSSLKSIVFSGDNVSQSGLGTTVTSTTLTTTGDRTWQVVVTDKRNRSTTATLTRTVYPYAAPAIGDLQSKRSDSSGNDAPNDGTYASVWSVFSFSDVGGNNSLVIKKIYYKVHSASNWVEGVSAAQSSTWETFGNGGILMANVYDIKVEIEDAVGNTATAFAEVNSVIGFAVGLKNDRARFGGPVQKAGLQVDWDADFLGNAEIQGDLTVDGDVSGANGSLSGTLSVTGDATFGGAINTSPTGISSPAIPGDLSCTGNYIEANPSDVDASNSTYTNVASITLTAGKWMIWYTVRFNDSSSTTGRRMTVISNSSSSTTSIAMMLDDVRNTTDGQATMCKANDVLELRTSTTYYLWAWQNSGATVSCTARLHAIRIC